MRVVFLREIMKECYYAVARGWEVGIYRTWTECKKITDGFPNARFKKFGTEKEAREFIEINGKLNVSSKGIAKTIGKSNNTQAHLSASSSIQSGSQEIPSRKETSKGAIPIVYTDGACVNNGQNWAKAGIGVFWGDSHPDNVSEPIEGKATNNRAEYVAIIRAIQKAIEKRHSALIIRTDCQLIIKSMTLWMKGWKKKGWKTMNGTAVANQDLLQQIDQLIMSQIDVRFEKVQGHSNDYGNDQADFLAREGAKLYRA